LREAKTRFEPLPAQQKKHPKMLFLKMGRAMGLSWILGREQKRGFALLDVLGSLHSHGALAKIRSNPDKISFCGGFSPHHNTQLIDKEKNANK